MIWVHGMGKGTATGVCEACLAVIGPVDPAGVDAVDEHHENTCPGRPSAGLPASARKRAERLIRGDY